MFLKLRSWLNQKFHSRRSRLALVAVLLGAFGTSSYFVHTFRVPDDYRFLYLNDTPSLPRGIYLRVPNLMNLSDGAYVVFTPNEITRKIGIERGWFKEDTYFLKKVGAVAGEPYRIDPVTHQFFANGKYVGQIQETDSEKRPIPGIQGDFIVPEGEFLPIGEHPKSFDGRYTGTVPIQNIRARVVPLFTAFHW